MKLFGWKMAGRASARPVLSRVYGAPLAWGEWPRSYEAQVREGYLDNAVAQRAVRLVAEGVAAAPFRASDARAGALVRATSAGQGLLETVAMHLLLHGNAYVELLPGPDGAPAELYALRPERVSIEADARGWPIAFVYKAAGREGLRLGADAVVHIRSAHPLDDHYGLGCLGAAAGAVAIHNAAAKWNKALLDNAARPSGALVQEGAEPLSGDQFDRLKAELEAGFQGAANAGRPMLLEGGLRWQALSLSPADMDFIALKAAAAREIALAFGVPPMLLGLPGDATYANYREANRALWRQAILPLAGKILDALAQGLRPWFAGLELAVEIDRVGALAEDRERLWAQLGAAAFLTVDEKRAAAGFAALPHEPPAPPTPVNDNAVGTVGAEGAAEEVKFNPNHDELGRFTFSGQGRNFGGGGAGGSWDNQSPAPRPKTPPLPGTLPARQGGKPVRRGAGDKFKTGGGSFGGGGATGGLDSPDRPKPKPPATKPVPASSPSRLRLPSVRTGQQRIRVTSGQPKRSASPTMRRIASNGYDFDVDGQNRTRVARGSLKLGPGQGRSRTSQLRAGGANRKPDDQGGHYIGRQFDGPKEAHNHFAQNKGFNNGGYRRLETKWRQSIESGKKISVKIQAQYDGASERPHTIKVKYRTNRGKARRRKFSNSIESKAHD